MIEQRQISMIFCTHMVDICRHGDILIATSLCIDHWIVCCTLKYLYLVDIVPVMHMMFNFVPLCRFIMTSCNIISQDGVINAITQHAANCE